MTSDDYPYWTIEEWWGYYPEELVWFFLDADWVWYPPAEYWEEEYANHG